MLNFGLQRRHCDSGSPCSSHQSAVARNAAASEGLQRVHMDSGTWCSSHQSSWEPGTACDGACLFSPPALAGALVALPSGASSFLQEIVERVVIVRNIATTVFFMGRFSGHLSAGVCR
jgi:hypothetical protein